MPILRIEALHLPYGVSQLDLTLPRGKLIGIVGANGAGKSSLLKAMAGILRPIQGRILVDHQDLAMLSPMARQQQIAYLAQDLNMAWALRVDEVIALGLPRRSTPHAEREAVWAAAVQFNVQSLLDKTYPSLSGGEKTRVQLARCCIKHAPLLLADEPIAALDPYYQIDIMQQLKALTPAQTCVLVIHHLPLAYRFCDVIVLLHQGRLLAYGETQAVLNAENLAKAFGVQAMIDPIQREIYALEKLDTSFNRLLE